MKTYLITTWISTTHVETIIRKLENNFHREVRLLMLTKNKLNNIREEDPEFYFRLKLTSVYSGDVFD